MTSKLQSLLCPGTSSLVVLEAGEHTHNKTHEDDISKRALFL